MVGDSSSATQADYAAAWHDTYVAWEGCDANMALLREVLAGQNVSVTVAENYRKSGGTMSIKGR